MDRIFQSTCTFEIKLIKNLHSIYNFRNSLDQILYPSTFMTDFLPLKEMGSFYIHKEEIPIPSE